MKRLKHMVLCALVLAFSLSLALTANAQETDFLTLERVVQISDYEVVIEFSVPIAIKLADSTINGPFVCIRMFSGDDDVLWDAQADPVIPVQWELKLEFVDQNRDRLLGTLSSTVYNVDTINDITGYKGTLSRFSENYTPKFCVEEIPYDTNFPYNDGFLDNITTLDGERHLLATRPQGLDGALAVIERDYSYEIDRTACFGIKDNAQNVQIGMAAGTEPLTTATDDSADETPDPLYIGLFLGGTVLICVLAIVLVSRSRKKEVRS